MGKIQFCNVGCADCTVIQTGSETILIDCEGIEEYKSLLPSNKKLKGVFITHQHRDHFGGLKFLKENKYTIEHLIYSPYKRRHNDNSVELDEWNDFATLRDHFEKQGAKLKTPMRQSDWNSPWWKVDNCEFWILAPFKDLAESSTRELHDACLVIELDNAKRRFAICGDASDASLEKLANNTKNFCDDVLRCSHHGSINGADLTFIKKANPKYTMISTKSGVHNNVPHPTALARYKNHTREKVYRTDVDGSRYWSLE